MELWILLPLLTLTLAQHHQQQHNGHSLSCTDRRGHPQKCTPPYQNIAFHQQFTSTSTCGDYGSVEYCVQSGALGVRRACDICDAADPRRAHPPSHMTDLTANDNETWWQSESMYEGLQGANLTVRFRKSFDLVHITLKFHSARPESMAMYKRTASDSPWTPFQYFSQSCRDRYGLPDLDSIQGNEQEARALCISEYSEHSPLTGGTVAFLTLEGRPSKLTFETSKDLNDWVAASEILISLDRLNTFGDEVFGDEKVLRSYYYAVSDITIGGTCKCNGHAKECVPSTGERDWSLVCVCEHNTDGVDCEKCLPFYNDAPWGRATSVEVHECKACNCNGFSSRCFFDKKLYELTGHGGHCTDCAGNRDGDNCEKCKPNFYQRPDGYCIPCHCNAVGSRSLQCNSEGKCSCQPGVTSDKCDRCQVDFYEFSERGCKECSCFKPGSLGNKPDCDVSGVCSCKENVEGRQCNKCKLGHFSLDEDNEFGCTPCFCSGHSSVCRSSGVYGQVTMESLFQRGSEKWTALTQTGTLVPTHFTSLTQNLQVTSPSTEPVYFSAPDRFLGDQRGSYNQQLNFSLRIGETGPKPSSEDVILQGSGLTVSRPIFAQGAQLPTTRAQDYSVRLHEHSDFGWNPKLSSREFTSILSNLTAIKIRGTYSPRGIGFLDTVKLSTARIGASGTPAPWVESCTCPEEYVGMFCESCNSGYTREPKNGGPFARCVKCSCHGHGLVTRSTTNGVVSNYTSCDPNSGQCICEHNTSGDNCEKCARGFYGNARVGAVSDCSKCPCPDEGACIQLGDESIVCLECPVGYAGPQCEVCGDGYYGDPSKGVPCKACDCNGNIDPNAVGNCHRITGECLKCIHNTGGPKCDKCLPGFFGDGLALPKGDCKPCLCSPLGSISTDSQSLILCTQTTGQCPCKQNVVDRQCDKCEEGHYDLASGSGCKNCLCDLTGSVNVTCNTESGQCICREGVVGLTCKDCAPNRYGFSTDGCKPCECDWVGSLGLQCGPDGQCVCRENVEGRACDRCKENKQNRQLGCVDCPHCYNLILDAVSAHRLKLTEMSRLLEDIRDAPTVISDREFEQKLNQVQQRVNKLWTDSRSATGSDDRSFIEKINELRDRLKALGEADKQIRSTIDSCSVASTESTRNLTTVEATIERASEALRGAARFLDTEGKDALTKAEAKSLEQGQQSSILSELARQTRLLSEEHSKSAEAIEKIGLEALNTSTIAHELARNSIVSQREASDEAKLLLKSIAQLEDEVKVTGVKARESLAKARDAYNDALSMFKNADTLTLPIVDLETTKEQAMQAKSDAERLKQSVATLIRARDLLLTESQEEAKQTRLRLNSAVQHQQIAEDLMGDLDKAKAEAEEARVQSENTFKQAQEIYDTLEGFNRNVDASKEKARQAEEKIPNIQELIGQAQRETAENSRDLDGAKRLTSQALADANDAKTVAEKASKDSNSIRSECNATKILAGALRDETSDLTGKVAETSNRLAEAEKRTGDNDSQVKTALDKASEAQSTARSTHEKVQSALNTVRDIQLALDNLPDINEAGLDGLEDKISQVEREFGAAKLDEKLTELRAARNQQSLWLKSHEDELAMLRKEVENIQEIRATLPNDSKCWKRTRLEP